MFLRSCTEKLVGASPYPTLINEIKAPKQIKTRPFLYTNTFIKPPTYFTFAVSHCTYPLK